MVSEFINSLVSNSHIQVHIMQKMGVRVWHARREDGAASAVGARRRHGGGPRCTFIMVNKIMMHTLMQNSNLDQSMQRPRRGGAPNGTWKSHAARRGTETAGFVDAGADAAGECAAGARRGDAWCAGALRGPQPAAAPGGGRRSAAPRVRAHLIHGRHAALRHRRRRARRRQQREQRSGRGAGWAGTS